MPGPTPIAAVETWRPVMEAAGWQCQCTGGCGRSHAKEAGGRCKTRHADTTPLLAAAAKPTDNPHADLGKPLVAYCTPCRDGHRLVWRRAQKALSCPAEELFGADGTIPDDVLAAPTLAPVVAVVEAAPAELVTLPHAERGNFREEAGYVVAEAMRLTVVPETGRVKFWPGARLAVDSLIAQGWTPPAAGESGEAAGLRATLLRLQRELDAERERGQRLEAEAREMDRRRGALATPMLGTVQSMRELAKVAAVDGLPEPTYTATKVADALEAVLRKDSTRRTKAKAA